MPNQDRKEECRARENHCTRADAEVLESVMVSAEHRHDDKELNEITIGTIAREIKGVTRCLWTAML